jgi:cellulose synthase/poly-beta-1,6-N-acetylglucosamine synthase-like glycosyltransferase
MFIQTFFLLLSLLLTVLFFLYGFNHYYLLAAARRYRTPGLQPEMAQFRPPVAIHLPIYNEKYVVGRLVEACLHMAAAYGREKVTITVIDDSTDETIGVVDALVQAGLNQHFQIEVLRRDNRQGYKAGALQVALERTSAEFIAVFDADYAPPADFLMRTLPYFAQDETVAIIQSRWVHLNRDFNLLTRAIAIGIDVHFLVEQAGRYAEGCFQNFNGSGGVLRKTAVVAAGGWQADTLAEDLDVSYRMQLLGHRILYLRDLQSPGEIPPTVPSFKKQQGRWANGSLRTARKLLPALLFNPTFSFKQRLQALIHLTGYLIHPLMFVSFLLACLATLFGVDSLLVPTYLQAPFAQAYSGISLRTVAIDLLWSLLALMILLCMTATWISPVVALKAQQLPISQNLPGLLVLFLLGAGISLSNTVEAIKALFTNRIWEFKRTPKYARLHSQDSWRNLHYQVPMDMTGLLELALAGLGLAAMVIATQQGNFAMLVILLPYTAAYAFVATFTFRQSQPSGMA